MVVAKRPLDLEIDPAVIPINDDPGTDFRDWLGDRPAADPVDTGAGVAEIIREIREHRET